MSRKAVASPASTTTRRTPKGGRKHKGALTAFQRRFCLEYLVDGNAAGAYRRAGGRHAKASTAAWLLMHRTPTVTAELDRLQTEQFKRLQMTADETLAMAAHMVRAQVHDCLDEHGAQQPIEKWPAQLRASIASVEFEPETVAVLGESGQPVLDDAGRPLTVTRMRVAKFRLHDKNGPLGLLFRKHGLIKSDGADAADSFAAAFAAAVGASYKPAEKGGPVR